MKVEIRRSTRADKKYMVNIPSRSDASQKTIHFGGKGYDDFTTRRDPSRKAKYVARHTNEDWTEKGIFTAGFWAKHLLWNKPSLRASAADILTKFGLTVNLRI